MNAKTLTALGLVLAALALSGCGRRGALEAPGARAQQTGPATAATTSADTIPLDRSSSISTAADGAPLDTAIPVRRGQITPPDRPFILDKIL